MSVKPVELATIISPAPKMPEASIGSKVSKFVQDDQFQSSCSSKKPIRNMSVHHLTTIEETAEDIEPIGRPLTPKNLTPPAPKPAAKEDFRRMALMNKAMSLDNMK
ncbi:MAG TPA: hypothetical protein VIJ14_09070 [Rhabdochlamydiaceae bacterium]